MNFDIDLVYLWVDGSDPKWRKKREQFVHDGAGDTEATSKARYSNNDELRYALRSVEKFIPWIRQIFIVTDDQEVPWLNLSHPGVHVVDVNEILPQGSTPCFNSNVIEYYLYKIPQLSECFLYSNDDMYFNDHLTPEFFFKADMLPIVRMKRNRFGRWYNQLRKWVGRPPGHYNHIISQGISLIKEKYHVNFYGIPHHNIDAYRKSDYRVAVEEVFRKEIDGSRKNRLRSFNDVQRFTFSLYALATGRAHPQYITKRTSLRNQLYKNNFEERMEKFHPKLFCMNDNQRATDADREAARLFLEKHFPGKSSFEK